MNEKVKFILTLAALIIMIGGVAIAYNYLSERNDPDTGVEKEKNDSFEQAKDFIVYDKEGNEIKLSTNVGKPVVVNFWASWCGPCTSELPHFQELYDKYGEDVVFMMVNMTDGYNETVDGVEDFLNEYGYSFPVYYDTEYSASYAYNVSAIPQTLFINSKGELVETYTGAIRYNVLENYIKEISE